MSDNAELAAVKAELAEIKKQLPRVTTPKAPDDVPLALCNEIAARAQSEVLTEKRDAATLAKKAIDDAFSGRPQRRTQKNVSPIVAERLAKK